MVSLPPLQAHPSAKAVVAKKMIQRLVDDLGSLAPPPAAGGASGGGGGLGTPAPQLKGFESFGSGSGGAAQQQAMVSDVIRALEKLVAEGTAFAEAELPRLIAEAAEGGKSASEVERLARLLALSCGAEAAITLELLAEHARMKTEPGHLSQPSVPRRRR